MLTLGQFTVQLYTNLKVSTSNIYIIIIKTGLLPIIACGWLVVLKDLLQNQIRGSCEVAR